MLSKETVAIYIIIVSSIVFLALSILFIFLVIFYSKKFQNKKQEMLENIIHAQEDEQTRIARDLHDHIRPLISIIQTQLECIKIEDLSKDDQKIISDLLGQVSIMSGDIRNIAYNMIPQTLKELGLVKNLYIYITRLNEYNPIKINFDCNELPENINYSQQLALYCIIQELIQNSLKHSKATTIDIILEKMDNYLILEYSDNGIGYTPNKGNSAGIGIKSIENRAQFLKAVFRFETSDEYGFSFILEMKI